MAVDRVAQLLPIWEAQPLPKRRITSSLGHEQFITHLFQFTLITPCYAIKSEQLTASLNNLEVDKRSIERVGK